MAYREVLVFEIKEVLQLWLRGEGYRGIDRLSGVDRKTVRRYVEAAVGAGLTRDGGEGQLGDVLIGTVCNEVRPARPAGHGAGWDALGPHEAEIKAWLAKGLNLVKVQDLLARSRRRLPHAQPLRHPMRRVCAGQDHGAGQRRRAGLGTTGRLRGAWA